MRSPGLAALVDDGVFLTLEAQLQLADEVGDHSWGVDLAAGEFRFEGERPATHPVQLLGSAAPGPRSWLWGWANPSGYPEAVLRAGVAARDLGAQYGIPELASPEVSFDVEERDDVEPGYALAYDLSIAARVASRTWFGYSGQVQGGTRVWMLLEGRELAAPDVLRVSRVIAEGLTSTTVTDHRRAVGSYAALRGLPWDGALLQLPNGEVTVEFDELGRIANLAATARPA
jgi:hypothetical protein